MTYTVEVVNGRVVVVDLDANGNRVKLPPPALPPSGPGLDYPPGTASLGLVNGMPDGSEVIRPLATVGNPQGSTDDAGIINDSLNRCGHTRLVPGATYTLLTPVQLPSGATFEGRGTLTPGAGFSGTYLVDLASTNVVNVNLADLTLALGFAAGVGGIGVVNTNPPADCNNVIRNCTVSQPGGAGITVTNSAGTQLRGCFALSTLGAGFALNGFDLQVVQCQAGVTQGHAFDINCSNSMIAGNKGWFAGFNAQTNTWANSASCGFFTESPANALQFNTIVNNSAQQNASHGYFCTGLLNTWAGNEADTNSAFTVGGGVGSGFAVQNAINCVLTGNTGGNNLGLGRGSQLWGIQYLGTNNAGTVATGNYVIGSSGAQSGAPVTLITLLPAWTAGVPAPKWAFVDSGMVSTSGLATVAAFAGTMQIGTVPAAATPNNYQPVPAWNQANTPMQVAFTNTGQVQAVNAPAGTTGVFWNGTYPLQS